MPRFTFQCWSCGELIKADGVFRSDTCHACEADLKVCKTCRHYDTGASNECRETAAEYVYDKERANYCGYFAPRAERIEAKDDVDEARAKLEALFEK